MATKTTKKATKKVEAQTRNVTGVIRKGALAYVGLYVAAYDRVKPMIATTGDKAEKFFGELVEKGETVEAQAGEVATTAKTRAFAFAAKAREALPTLPKAANDRVAELEAEIAKLNKKVKAKAKATSKKATKVVTEKTTAKKAA